MPQDYTVAEKLAATILSRTPALKARVKYCYQAAHYLINRPSSKRDHPDNVTLTASNLEGNGSFWGYYDKSPIRDGHRLFHSFPAGRAYSDYGQPVDIVLDDRVISSSSAWNWQQGSMTAWLGPGDARFFIHNDFDGEKYISQIVDAESGEKQTVDFPVYQVASGGDFALSLNFTRLAKLRPDYGYRNIPTDGLKPIDSGDGVYRVDLESNRTDLILSLEEIACLEPQASMRDAWHKVNHIMIAPDGRRFIFLHRWYPRGGSKQTRLLTCGVDGADLYCLLDDGMVSHCNWIDNEKIVAYARKKTIGDRYLVLQDESDRLSVLDHELLCRDGHPSISPDGRWMVTDTYPDRSRMRSLILYNLESNEAVVCGRFFESLKWREEYRCDLHPRWAEDGRTVTFDSDFDGVRKMYSIEVGSLIAREDRA